jgi:hypothetical protein
MVAAVGVAAGVWLVVGAIWPAPRSLSAALGRLHAPGRPQHDPSEAAGEHAVPFVVGRWVLRRARRGLLADESMLADLAILHRPPELAAGVTALAVVAGALAGPMVWVFARLAGTPLPWLVPVWLVVTGAVIGYLTPRLLVRSQAAAARRDFRHALGAYLDVLVLLLAAHEGPESAMDLAAQAGHGPAFDELRQATFRARLSGDAVWTALDELGARIHVAELREIASAGTLAGESGAAVRKSLTAKARALRAASLSAAEATARKQSQAMFAPLVVMGIGFILFLLYPLVTNLSVGR